MTSLESQDISFSPNPLVQFLQKPAKDFTKSDLMKYIAAKNIRMINFRYIGGDGKLKTLNFVITGKEQLDSLLSCGERVDGSSLFSFIDAKSSDLYVVPRYKTAFHNPFSDIPTLDILCAYFDKEGNPLASAPENVMMNAHKNLQKSTGYSLDVMGELEYYVISEKKEFYPAMDQRGYHESEPFAKFEQIRRECMDAIAQAGGLIKYAHSEVGNFTSEDDMYYEQNEIEFNPTNIEDAADQLTIAKWIIRMVGNRHGVNISFAPKITVGKAGSGLHIHMKLHKNGKTATIENGRLSDTARKAIAGILDLAPALTAFGNTNPTSYLRLVPHQEAPTNICWGDRNRSVLIRVPLGWVGVSDMIKKANPNYDEELKDFSDRQTFEFRCPDGSANIHLLLAGLVVGVKHGLTMENALENAKKLYVDVNIFLEEHREKLAQLDALPLSCYESAESLLELRAHFEKDDVFSPVLIDGIARSLMAYDDKGLSEKLYGKNYEIKKLVNKYLHQM